MNTVKLGLLSAGLLLACTAGHADRLTTYSYTPEGLVASIDGPRTDVADVTTYTYDAQGNLATTTNALGQVTHYTAYDGAGRLLSMTDANGVVSAFTYHPRGWLTSRTTAGATTHFQYDAVGNLTGLVLPDGSTITYSYDSANRLVSVSDGVGNRIDYTLDNAGNRTGEAVKDASGQLKRALSRVYDTLGRLAQEIGGSAQTSAFSYDANGNLTQVTDPLARESSTTYDALERVTRQIDPALGNTDYSYNAQDQVTSVTDPNGAVTQYEYNGFGDKIRQVSPDTGVTTYAYDEAGNQTSRTDARGITTAYIYDALNRLTSVQYPDVSLNVTYEYDQGVNGVGRLTAMHDAGGLSEYGYDARGNLVSQTRTVGSLVTVIGYAYDTSDRLTTITYPSGRQVHYQYDAAGQVSQVALEDGAGTQVLAGNISYLPFGPLASLAYGNGLALAREYDLDYRLTRQTIPGVLDATYGYDAVSNIRTWLDGLDASRDQTFDYDTLDRVIAATGSIADFGYSYDTVGNRLSETVDASLETYIYSPSSNRLTSIVGAITDEVVMDAAGNITHSRSGDFVYNDANRLAQFTAAGVQATYVYNGRGERVRKTVNGETTRFRYDDNGTLLAELDNAGNVIREYVYLEGAPVAILAPPDVIYYAHTGHLGSVIKMTNANQQVVWDADREPFGELAERQGVGEMPLRFPGQYYDAESGLFYNYFRYYDPATGRYITSDPIGLDGGLNTYEYALSNPVNRTDPWGLKSRPSGPIYPLGPQSSNPMRPNYRNPLVPLRDPPSPFRNGKRGNPELFERFWRNLPNQGGPREDKTGPHDPRPGWETFLPPGCRTVCPRPPLSCPTEPRPSMSGCRIECGQN